MNRRFNVGKLREKDEQMLQGQKGPAAQMAMRIMVRMAEVDDAPEMMDVSQAHIDGCGLLSETGLEFAETLTAKGAKVSIPTTLNMGPLDLQNWRKFGVDEDFAAKAIRQAKAYTDMGCIPAWTLCPLSKLFNAEVRPASCLGRIQRYLLRQ